MKKSSVLQEHNSIPHIVGHFKHMLDAKDGFSVLVRGMVLIDQGLDLLLNAYLTIPLKKLRAAIPQLALNGKASLALAIGAIDEDEWIFIRECNSLRNRVSHRMNINITTAEEEQIVALYNEKIKGFGSLSSFTNEPYMFPNRLAFSLILSSTRLRFRSEALKYKPLQCVRDNLNDSIASFGFAAAMMRLASEGGELDDDRVKGLVMGYVATASMGMRIVKAREKGATFEEAVASLRHARPRRRRYPRRHEGHS